MCCDWYKMKNHQPRLRVVAWVVLHQKLLIRLRFPRAGWDW
jgi:hypothetical protein